MAAGEASELLMSPIATVPLACNSWMAVRNDTNTAGSSGRSMPPRVATNCFTQSVNFAAGGTRPRSHESSK